MKIVVHEIRYESKYANWMHCFREVSVITDVFQSASDRWVTTGASNNILKTYLEKKHDIFLELFFRKDEGLSVSIWTEDKVSPKAHATIDPLWDKSKRIVIDPISMSSLEEAGSVIQVIQLLSFVLERVS